MAAVPAGAADTGFDQVVSGLSNPRGIAFSANGTLYVAEGGNAGTVCFPGESTEEGGALCAGQTAGVARVDVRAGTATSFLSGLVSLGDSTGLFSIGASGLAVKGNQVFAVMGGNPAHVPPVEVCAGSTDPAGCPDLLAAAGQQLGGVVRAVPSGRYAWRQNVGAANYQWVVDNNGTIPLPGWKSCLTYPDADPCNPDFAPGDANPYAAVAGNGGIYVADGGSNTVTWVPQNGTPEIIAALPNGRGEGFPYDAVATCVATVGHQLLIGDLNGRVYLYDGSTMFPEPLTLGGTGFLASIGGCGSDGHGHVYLTDIFLGTVMRLTLSDLTLEPVAEGLSFPAGVAVAKDGSVYVANNGVCPSTLTGPVPGLCSGSGEIVRLHNR
jgi:hypothetical protein